MLTVAPDRGPFVGCVFGCIRLFGLGLRFRGLHCRTQFETEVLQKFLRTQTCEMNSIRCEQGIVYGAVPKREVTVIVHEHNVFKSTLRGAC